MDENKVTYFAQTDSRNKKVPFGVKSKDRTRHIYVIGKTGMGKSTLLENMAVQDIQGGEGICFVDPHGKTAELLLEYVPEHRMKDVLYFAPFDLEYPISFNVLEKVDPDKRHLVVAGLMSTFKKIWEDAWSARMEYILSNTLLALLEFPEATLLGVNRMLADKEYRKKVVDNVTDPSVKSFWVDEFAKYTERFAAEATPAIQNKIGQFTSNALIRNMIGQPESSFDFRKLMDEKKIIVVNLSKGRIGESNANLLGGMLITKIYLSAMSRADVPDRTLKTLPNFYLFVDEFQSFANESFADILSEARKYKLNLTIAHQYIEQMEEEVRAAVFGNVGTMIVFRVGSYDAEVLEKEFAPQFTAEDIVNLGFAQVYLKLMIDGISSPPFSATTLPPIKEPAVSFKDRVVEMSRRQFARPRAEVEANIQKWHEPMPPSAGTGNGNGNAGGGSGHGKGRDRHEGDRGPKERVSGSGKLSDEIRRQVIAQEVQKTAPPPVPKVVPEAQIPAVPKPPKEAIINPVPPAPQIEQVQPVSLNNLQKAPSVKNTGKVLTEKNVNDLKSALAQVLKGAPQTDIATPKEKVAEKPKAPPPVSKGVSGPQEVKQEPKKEPIKETTKEIPEDVLKNLLKIDK